MPSGSETRPHVIATSISGQTHCTDCGAQLDVAALFEDLRDA